ncbi:hypothetical protein RRG08_027445 [Elysia crispata]|nr:hypothetical protein RRG08_027445 [Elysia crispata]
MQTKGKTGAERLHMARDDGNNYTQCYVLHNTDGQHWVPDILENTILCGFENPESLILQETQNELLPSHTYGVLSRGDVAHIISLTHQQLQDLHAEHYDPI